MSLAIPSDGRGRSGSGETQARPKVNRLMTAKYLLFLYLNEKLLKRGSLGHWATMKC